MISVGNFANEYSTILSFSFMPTIRDRISSAYLPSLSLLSSREWHRNGYFPTNSMNGFYSTMSL